MDAILNEFNQLWNDLTAFLIRLIPHLALAMITLVVGLSLAWLVQRLTRRFILYIDRNINENLKSKLLRVDLRNAAKIISKALFWIIVVFSVALVSQVLGLSMLTNWFDEMLRYVPNAIAVLFIVIFGIIAGKLVGDLSASAAIRGGMTDGKRLGKFVQYIVLFIAIIIAVDQIGIDILFLTILLTTAVAAMLFGAALAFGLGARASVSNILGSYYLQKIYQEGNTIRMGNVEGVIVKITPTTVIVETKSGQVAIPAKDFNEKKTVLIKKPN